MSPSPDWLEDMSRWRDEAGDARWGARWWMKCCTQAKLALPFGGVPYCQRTSSRGVSPPQSEIVERRVGEDEVGPQILVQVAVEGVGVLGAESASMPRMARFILASRQVVALTPGRRC
jgi:hypothetical protein